VRGKKGLLIDKRIRRILIIVSGIFIIVTGIVVFKVTNGILATSIVVVIMLIVISWQYIELQKDKERLNLLRRRETVLDKEIKENLLKIERLNKIQKEFNLQNKE